MNGQSVASGHPSDPISLTAGQTTPIEVEVTPEFGEPVMYTVDVTRSTSAYLSDLEYVGGRGASMTQAFSKHVFEYTATT